MASCGKILSPTSCYNYYNSALQNKQSFFVRFLVLFLMHFLAMQCSRNTFLYTKNAPHHYDVKRASYYIPFNSSRKLYSLHDKFILFHIPYFISAFISTTFHGPLHFSTHYRLYEFLLAAGRP